MNPGCRRAVIRSGRTVVRFLSWSSVTTSQSRTTSHVKDSGVTETSCADIVDVGYGVDRENQRARE
jgi:hypothetical protein